MSFAKLLNTKYAEKFKVKSKLFNEGPHINKGKLN